MNIQLHILAKNFNFKESSSGIRQHHRATGGLLTRPQCRRVQATSKFGLDLGRTMDRQWKFGCHHVQLDARFPGLSSAATSRCNCRVQGLVVPGLSLSSTMVLSGSSCELCCLRHRRRLASALQGPTSLLCPAGRILRCTRMCFLYLYLLSLLSFNLSLFNQRFRWPPSPHDGRCRLPPHLHDTFGLIVDLQTRGGPNCLCAASWACSLAGHPPPGREVVFLHSSSLSANRMIDAD